MKKTLLRFLALFLTIFMLLSTFSGCCFLQISEMFGVGEDLSEVESTSNNTEKPPKEDDEEDEDELENVVPDIVASLFGIDPDEWDSDGDGLSNYIEIYITGTNPTLKDTDGNGIDDNDEDADRDGLTNIEEIRLETNLAKVDTDSDGISDYDEVRRYDTAPLLADTDEDGLFDGDELVLGLNPLEKMTDGITLDSERIFTQNLSKENIYGELTNKDNAAIPSLTLTSNGNINSNAVVVPNTSGDFGDSRAIVGLPIDIECDSFESGTISFKLKDAKTSYMSSELSIGYNTNLICKYNKDGSVEYLDTEFDEDNNTVYANINDEGTYFVLNVENLFNELGLALPRVDQLDAVTISERVSEVSYIGKSTYIEDDAAEDSDEESVTIVSPGVMAQADIIFIIDTTGSMGDEINNVKNNVQAFVDALKEKGVSAGFALIDYQDLEADGYDSTRVHQNGSSNWFYDMDAYKTVIANLGLGNGGDIPECAVDALETARLLDMRPSAGKIFVLVTDANYKDDNRYGIGSMEEEIDLLIKSGVTCAVVSSSDDKDVYEDLYTKTGGIWANIYGDFYTELMTLADKIGEDIVGDGYMIYLDGPIPVPVRLDAEPTADSNIDTDGDGLLDIEELEGATPSGRVDLDALLTKVSKGAITGTKYGVVLTYKYTSNPTEKDTDFDGRYDNDEKIANRRSSLFTADMKYKIGDNNYNGKAEFKVDYRYFFEDNTKFNQELAVLASLFVMDMYDGGWLEVTEGATGASESENGVALGEIFGLKGKNINAETLLNEYSEKYTCITEDGIVELPYDSDDVSEVYVGYRTVECRGEKRVVFFLMVRGTNGTEAEWSSNFDVGADDNEYYEKTGLHPEWVNKDNHKGFDVAKERILKAFNKYIKELEESGEIDVNAKRSIFISGHSRGAAIANLLGAYFEDSDDYDSYVYTMAAPFSTTDENAEDYRTIFNIMNEDDLVPYLPLSAWGFKKYGRTLMISAGEYDDSNPLWHKKGTFEYLFGEEYDDNSTKDGAVNCFEALVDLSGSSDDIRRRLYEYDTTSDDGEIIEGSIVYFNDDRYEELCEYLATNKLDKYCLVEKNEVGDGYNIKITYSPAYLMKIIACLASAEDMGARMELIGLDLKGRYSQARTAFVTTFLLGMECPHIPGTYYLISQNTPYSSYTVD